MKRPEDAQKLLRDAIKNGKCQGVIVSIDTNIGEQNVCRSEKCHNYYGFDFNFGSKLRTEGYWELHEGGWLSSILTKVFQSRSRLHEYAGILQRKP